MLQRGVSSRTESVFLSIARLKFKIYHFLSLRDMLLTRHILQANGKIYIEHKGYYQYIILGSGLTPVK